MPLSTSWIAEALVERFGWQVVEGSMLHRRLLKVVGRGQIEAAHRQRQDLEGEARQVVDQTFAPEQYWLDEERKRSRRGDASISIMGLFKGYATERKPAPATVKAWRRQLAAFVTFLGHDDASRVGHGDVVRWKDHLLSRITRQGGPLSARTVQDTYLAALKTTFRWAVDNGKCRRTRRAGHACSVRNAPAERSMRGVKHSIFSPNPAA